MGKPYRGNKTPASKPETYEPAEVRALMDACHTTPTGLRDRAAIMLLWCSGMQTRELCEVVPTDLDRDKGALVLAHREIAMPQSQCAELWRAVDAWAAVREDLAKLGAPLFCSLHGVQLDTSYWRHALPRVALRAGVSKRVHVQGFRQTFAAALYRADVPMEVIRRQLGHSDVAFTATYVERICPRRQEDAMADFSLE